MRDIEALVRSCPECEKHVTPSKEPLLQSTLPPWEKVASDLFELEGQMYLMVVDYYSRFIEVKKLGSTSSDSVIKGLKTLFSHYGIPAVMVSDNGLQYSSNEMEEFADHYGFSYITSSSITPKQMD